nr:PREDICTED: ras-related protein Rab-32-like [Bemisia tabaci]
MPALYNRDIPYCDDFYEFDYIKYPTEVKTVTFKFLVIGDYGVGKTAIVRRYAEGRFCSNYKVTIGADFAVKSVMRDKDVKVNLQLWDIAGQERYGFMTRVYYKHAIGAVVVFDVSRMGTFKTVVKWLTDLREKVALYDGSPVPVVLLANKCDIAGAAIPTETIKKFCRDHGIEKWFPTSAKEDINIDEAMDYLIDRALDVNHQETKCCDTVLLQGKSKSSKRCCFR